MLQKYEEKYFWNKYFRLVDNNEENRAKQMYAKYLIYTYVKYLLFMYIPAMVITWFLTEKVCDIVFNV